MASEEPFDHLAPPALSTELAAVMGELGAVVKRGRNAFHHYAYITESDVLDAVRQHLAARGIRLFVEVGVPSYTPIGTKGQCRCDVQLRIGFANARETLTYDWAGCGADAGDKGLYKAITGGVKYFLLKHFLIPSCDDPEADEATDAAVDPPDDEPIATAPPDTVTVTDVTFRQTKNPEVRQAAVTFSDGTRLTTIDGRVQQIAQRALQDQRRVRYRTTTHGKWTNLAEILDGASSDEGLVEDVPF